MRCRLLLRLPVCTALLALSLATPASARTVLFFGDSWGQGEEAGLSILFADLELGVGIADATIGGQLAADLSNASGLSYISSSLSFYPDADLVHLSIGGLDFLSQWSSSLTPAQEQALFQSIVDDVETIVDHILSIRPEARVFWSGYTYPRPLGTGTPAEMNAAGAALNDLASQLADEKGESLTFGDYFGLMQVSYGFDGIQHTPFDPAVVIPPGDPSLPDPTFPGPFAAFADSIHLTLASHEILAQAHYDDFYRAILNPAPPVPLLGAPGLAALAAVLIGAATGMVIRRR